MSTRPLFTVNDHHPRKKQHAGDDGESASTPHIDDTTPDQYRGYFEDEFGRQAIFVYDWTTRTGTLRMSRSGWQHVYRVVNGVVEGPTLSGPAAVWLTACLSAVTTDVWGKLRPGSGESGP